MVTTGATRMCCSANVRPMVIAAGRPGESRVAIVTGGSRGMGRETIKRLASLGYAVVVNYVHDQRAAESTVEAVLEGRGTAVTIRADVADVLDVERLFAQTIETFGAVDAVVHAVRGHVAPSPLTEVAVDDFDEMCRTTSVRRSSSTEWQRVSSETGGADRQPVQLGGRLGLAGLRRVRDRRLRPSMRSRGCSHASSANATSPSTVCPSTSTRRASPAASPTSSRTCSAATLVESRVM